MTTEEKILAWLRRGPLTRGDMFYPSVGDIGAVLQRLRRRGVIRCGVDVPSTAWHLVEGCPCPACAARRP